MLAEQQAQRCQRHEGNGQVQHEFLRPRLAGQARQYRADLDAVFPANRQDGANLNHDGEQLGLFVVKVQQIARQNQMTGTGNRQNWSNPDHAQNQDLISSSMSISDTRRIGV